MLPSNPPVIAQWRQRRREILLADPAHATEMLSDAARQIRRHIVTTICRAGQGHIGGDLSVTDLLTVLYLYALEHDPAHPDDPDRDRFILSKGHCAVALYSTLATCGYIDEAELDTFMAPMSALSGHPNRTYVPGVETNTGPLGHGLPVAVGCAIGAKISGRGYRVVAVMGDGEMQEGSNWEALMCASHQGLDNLVAIVDRNRLQQGDRTEATNALDPLPDKLTAFGWETRVCDGHDYPAIIAALAPSTSGRPVAIVANTVKGRGVSFIEDRVEWHHKVPTAHQREQALEELA